jgi:two-component system LytT family response regulator
MRSAFTFSDNTNIIAIPFSDILYLLADGTYSKLYLKGGKMYLYSKCLSDALLKLDAEKFCRIHLSSIVNVAEVVCYQKGRTGTVIMSDGKHLSVAEAQKTLFLKMYGM